MKDGQWMGHRLAESKHSKFKEQVFSKGFEKVRSDDQHFNDARPFDGLASTLS
jgi:hypothetical protein